MSYSESLAKIKSARQLRDAARQRLYEIRMERLQLVKQQRSAAQRTILPAAGTDPQISVIKTELSELRTRQLELQKQLQHAADQKERLAALEQQKAGFQKKLEEIQRELAALQQDMAAPNFGDPQRRKLADAVNKLQLSEQALTNRLNAITKEIAALEKSLVSAENPQQIQAAIQELEARISALRRELDTKTRQSTRSSTDLSQELEKNKALLERLRANDRQQATELQQAIAALFRERGPQTLIGQWDDRIPILLQPVRLETKFSSGRQKELWVRIFPDDIAVVTHEPELTATETNYGIAYWKACWQAGDDSDRKKAAWRMLVEKFGSNRASWVARSTRPLNWEDRLQLPDAEALRFEVAQTNKDNSWTRAPHSRVLPDCFVLLGYRGGELVLTQTGKLIADILTLGPEPPVDGEASSLDRDEQNRIVVDEALQWMIDFDKAVEKGMALRVPLDTTSASEGFDQLMVVGLKLSADQEDGRQLLEGLLENHRYSKKGFELVPQGTPTNNTEAMDAGYSRQEDPGEPAGITEQDQVLFTPVSDLEEATDGQRMADFLGIDYALLQTTNHAQRFDHREAVAMNTALYAGTLGYYMQAMLGDVLDEEARGQLRQHFTRRVTGRGPIASFRVGNQPYGLLLTSDFAKWTYAKRSQRNDSGIPPYFYEQLYQVLLRLETYWQQQTSGLSHITKTGDTSQQLLDILGLHPHAVDYAQRVGYSWDSLKNLEAFGWGGKYFSDAWTMAIESMHTRNLLYSLGYEAQNDDGSSKTLPMLLQLIFRHYSSRLGSDNLIDEALFSEEDPIRPYEEAGSKNYIHWLIENADDARALEQQDFGTGIKPPHTLLYLLLRYAQLHEASQAIYHYLQVNQISAREIVQSRKFMNISQTPSVTHWEVFQAPVNQLITSAPSEQPLLKFIYQPAFSSDLAKNLAAHRSALEQLKELPTARLERLLVEHLDCLSYRLDAWQTSLFEQRLLEQRRLDLQEGEREKGIYLGAYGYLENLRPGQKRTPISEELLPAPLREQKDNLFRDPDNDGYIHAPTLNHATAAAILRNGYLTHASPAEREVLSVNLSSERIRCAQLLLEGIQNGQTLEALLGYQFERGLHDWTTRHPNPVILNQLIPYFREAFPIKKTKIPQKGKTTGPEEITLDYQVVNGMELAETDSAFPYGMTGLPALSPVQIAAIEQEKEGLINSLDALRDVLTAETAYQLALGNFERAAGVMQAISGTAILPQPEVISSGRSTRLSFTNKVILNLDPGQTTNPWPANPMTAKAKMESPLNHWLGSLLGSPAAIRCRVLAVDDSGNILTRPDNTECADLISMEALGLQPIDIVYLVQKNQEASGSSELETRIRYRFAQQEQLPDTTIVKIEFAESGTSDPAVKSFAEILPFADQLRQLIGSSRPVSAREYEPASRELVRPQANPENLDWAELLQRCQHLYEELEQLQFLLTAAVADAQALANVTAIDQLRSILKSIADAGWVAAFPYSAVGTEPDSLESLLVQAAAVSQRLTALQTSFQERLPQIQDTNTAVSTRVQLLTETIQAVLGGDFKVMPRYDFNNSTEIMAAYDHRLSLLDYSQTVQETPLPVAEWLHGISLVRSGMHTLENVRLLHETLNEEDLEMAPIQLPYREQDSWLALTFPEGLEILDDTLSILQLNPQGFSPAMQQCGLLIDAWPESIPNKEEVTGIGLNFNQPNAVPPQALLLTVSPEETGSWKWEHLIGAIRDSFARAKRRAIEPDQIDQMPGISTLLPATLTEFSTSKTGISLDYELISAQVYAQVSELIQLNTTN